MATFDQYMAGSGQQSTLDELRRTGQYDAAASAWSSGGNYGSANADVYNKLRGEVDAYIGELEKITNGDYDFIAKWLESNYKEAVGNDDGARQQILKEVANDLEKKVGRLGYDYQTGKYQIEENYNIGTTRLNEDTSTALSRLKQDEVELKRDWEMKAKATRQQEAGNLNQRGILSSTRENATGLAGSVVGETEKALGYGWDAINRAYQEGTADITRNQTRGLADLGLNKQRGLEALTTGTRRGYEDTSSNYNKSMESAKRERDYKLAQLQAQKKQSYSMLPSLSDTISFRSSGLV